MISKEQLEKFKIIYKNQFGEELSDQEALEKATKLLNMMKVIYRPIKDDTKIT
jgi:hypothetical protein